MNNIALLRKKHHISQSELGKILDVAQNTICNWENGNRAPDHHSLSQLADYFDVSVDYILGRESMHEWDFSHNRIRQLRKEIGLTAKKLGEMVNVAESTISMYETGKRAPDYNTLCRIADFFGVTVDYILGRDYPHNTASPGKEPHMPELSRFYNIIVRMLYNDDSQHHRPHFHVVYAEYEASVGIDGELLAGSLPVKQLRLVQAWAAIHEDELYRAWNNAVRGIPFDKIEPLR